MTYSKAFEKWYIKNPTIVSLDIVQTEATKEALKAFAFSAWTAAAKKVTARMGLIGRFADGHYQHEDWDHVKDFARELYKDE